jgi:hypothetical protein
MPMGKGPQSHWQSIIWVVVGSTSGVAAIVSTFSLGPVTAIIALVVTAIVAGVLTLIISSKSD